MSQPASIQEWKIASSSQVLPDIEPNTPDILSSPDTSTIQTLDTEDTTDVCYPHYIIVGDNINKIVSPHDMGVDNQSFHYFHSYAVQDKVDLRTYSTNILILILSYFS